MWPRLPARVGGLALTLTVVLWTATVISVRSGNPAAVALMKTAILAGLLLIPAMAVAGVELAAAAVSIALMSFNRLDGRQLDGRPLGRAAA